MKNKRETKLEKSHKAFDPKSYYFHQIKQASRVEKEIFFFSSAKYTKVVKDNGWRRTEPKASKKRWQKLNELWYHLIPPFDNFKPHGVFHHTTSICDKCFRTSFYEQSVNMSSYLLSMFPPPHHRLKKFLSKLMTFAVRWSGRCW